MATNTLPLQPSYTYDDYKKFPDELRCEIIDGHIYDMTPAPSLRHQEVVLQIGHLIRSSLEGQNHPCRVYIAPKLKGTGIFGAPEVIFEVLSPGTEIKDRGRKMEIYEQFGVNEYYLVHPDLEFVEKYILAGGSYGRPWIYREEQALTIEAIGMEITSRDLFAE